MKNGSIEKSAALSPAKIPLGQPAQPQPIAVEVSAPVEPAPSAAELELSAKLAACERELATLTSQLSAARKQLAVGADELQALRDSIESAHGAAQQQGYEAGLERGEEEGRAEWRQKIAEWESGLADLARQQRDFCADYAASQVDLVLACTVKILGDAAVDSQRARAALEHLIDESGLSGPLTVRIAPAQHEQLLQNGLAPRAGSVRLVPDASVAYGGGVLETAGVEVDGRYEAQLRKLRVILSEGGA